MKVTVKKSAVKELDALPNEVFKRVDQKITQLENGLAVTNTKKLAGLENTYRFRIGAYRVVYELNTKTGEVVIVRVAHRKDVYR